MRHGRVGACMPTTTQLPYREMGHAAPSYRGFQGITSSAKSMLCSTHTKGEADMEKMPSMCLEFLSEAAPIKSCLLSGRGLGHLTRMACIRREVEGLRGRTLNIVGVHRRNHGSVGHKAQRAPLVAPCQASRSVGDPISSCDPGLQEALHLHGYPP